AVRDRAPRARVRWRRGDAPRPRPGAATQPGVRPARGRPLPGAPGARRGRGRALPDHAGAPRRHRRRRGGAGAPDLPRARRAGAGGRGRPIADRRRPAPGRARGRRGPRSAGGHPPPHGGRAPLDDGGPGRRRGTGDRLPGPLRVAVRARRGARQVRVTLTPVDRRVREEIARHGPLPWSAVVEAALYDDEAGFYTTAGQAGRRGDFVTSPEVGALFGSVVARALDDRWVAM